MESIFKLIKIKKDSDIPDSIEITIEHEHMPQYDLKYMATSTLDNTIQSYLSTSGNWLPLKYNNDGIESGRYDVGFIYVNNKVVYKLYDVFIDGVAKEIIFNHVETIFEF